MNKIVYRARLDTFDMSEPSELDSSLDRRVPVFTGGGDSDSETDSNPADLSAASL